jgi:flagellar motor switch protein FliG
MRGLFLVLLTLAAAPLRASVTAEEAAIAERLAGQANDFLISLLGPGRGKAVVTVQGEQTISSSQAEYIVPTSVGGSSSGNTLTYLPGYNKDGGDKPKEKAPVAGIDLNTTVRKSGQSSSWDSGIQIKLVRVSVILDARLPKEQVAVVADLLPKLLNLDKERGDEISILRADLRLANWKNIVKDYLRSKEGAGTAALLSGVLVLILLSGLVLRLTANSAIRTFMEELSAQHKPLVGVEQNTGSPPPAAGAAPELLSGGMPSLSLEGEQPELNAGAAPFPQLGQRFDFLTSRSPASLALLIGGEPPQDLALLFATLAASHPDLSAAVFSALDGEVRAKVSRTLAAMTAADPEQLEMLENRLRNLVDFGVRGPERLGKILSRLPAADRETLFNEVVSANPDVAQELERSLFSFEDIVQLREADFRRLIVAVPYADWGIALRGAGDNVVQRVLGELEPGIQSILKEAMGSPQPRVKILEARSKVISQTLAMVSRGEIALQNNESAEMI